MTDPHESRQSSFAFLLDSYWGGERYRSPSSSSHSNAQCQWTELHTTDGGKATSRTATKRFASYLVPFPSESDVSFELRQRLASCVNCCQIVVDAYAESCTSDVQRQTGALEPYLSANVDGRGNNWQDFVEDSARWMAVYGEVYCVVDAPSANGAASRAEETERGIAPYCVLVHPTAVAWRKVDRFGKLTELAYVDETAVSDTGNEYSRNVTVRVWSSAGWEVLEGSISLGLGAGTLEKQRGKLKRIDGGPLAPALRGQIPVVVGYYKRDSSSAMPRGESLITDAADQQLSIYNKRSWEQQIAREAGFPTLVIPRGQDGGKLDAGTRITIGTSKAIGYDSASGAPQWIQPSAEWARDLRESCAIDFQHALRSAGLELAVDQSAQVSSGEALRIRSRDFESRAKRFARNLQRWETSVLRLFALLAGVSDEVSIVYPRRFSLPDMTADLKRATDLLGLGDKIGERAKIEALMQAVNAALTLPDEVQAEIRGQLEALATAAAASAQARANAPPSFPPREPEPKPAEAA